MDDPRLCTLSVEKAVGENSTEDLRNVRFGVICRACYVAAIFLGNLFPIITVFFGVITATFCWCQITTAVVEPIMNNCAGAVVLIILTVQIKFSNFFVKAVKNNVKELLSVTLNALFKEGGICIREHVVNAMGFKSRILRNFL